MGDSYDAKYNSEIVMMKELYSQQNEMLDKLLPHQLRCFRTHSPLMLTNYGKKQSLLVQSITAAIFTTLFFIHALISSLGYGKLLV